MRLSNCHLGLRLGTVSIVWIRTAALSDCGCVATISFSVESFTVYLHAVCAMQGCSCWAAVALHQLLLRRAALLQRIANLIAHTHRFQMCISSLYVNQNSCVLFACLMPDYATRQLKRNVWESWNCLQVQDSSLDPAGSRAGSACG